MKRARVAAGQLSLFDAPGAAVPPPVRRAADGSLELADAFRFEQNLVLVAGAGTGKTYSLVTLSLHLLAGARHLPGVEPSQVAVAPGALGLLTFTEKAATEMRDRLRARVDALAHGASEPELEASFAALGRRPPKQAFWRRVRDELGAAPIGTFHTLCVQLLKRAPAGSGINPAFELLDETEAGQLVHDCAERVALEGLAQDPAVGELCRAWGFADERGLSLSGALVQVFNRVREEGLAFELLGLGPSAAEAKAAFEQQLSRCLQALAQAPLHAKPDQAAALAEAARRCVGLSPDNAFEPGRLDAIKQLLKGNARAVSPVRQLFEGRADSDAEDEPHAHHGLRHYAGAVRAVPLERAARELLVALQREYQSALTRRAAMDFTALLVNTRNLLRDDLHARAEAQARFGALLIDEFQDTNRLQLELLHLLGERRGGERRPTTPPLPFGPDGLKVDELPLEPAFVCVVGDRKQSIYEFRGADVSVFEMAAQAIEKSGGGRAYLTQSRRSSPELISFFNQAFPRLLPTSQVLVSAPAASMPVAEVGRRYEVGFHPTHDLLTAHRPSRLPGPAVHRLVLPADTEAARKADPDRQRQDDARAVARHLRGLIDAGHQVVDPVTREPRAMRGGDVVLLFRRFAFVEDYRQALLREALAHRVVRGRGFYGAIEVIDLAGLLKVVADPSDAVSLASVLRSPLVGLSDSSLLRLALSSDGAGLDAHAVLRLERAPQAFSRFEAARFERFVDLHRRLRDERHRLGVRALLRVALDETGYREAIAGTTWGSQALANVDKLLELAGARDAAGQGAAGTFARELLMLADEQPTEAQAETVDEAEPNAVTLCTVHQAKGLEWPVVVLPDLVGRPPSGGARLRLWRPDQLVVAMTDQPSLRAEKAKADRARRERAESRRLLYVALTRARDLVVLGAGPGQRGTWWAWLDEALQAASVRALVTDVEVSAAARPRTVSAASPRPSAAIVDAKARLQARPRPVARSATLPVTQLQDFELCPRRYRLAHLVGLPEERGALPYSGEAPEPGSLDVRERGTAAHKLLELTPLEAVGAAGLPALLEALERAEGLPEDPEVRRWVEGFWRTDFARAMAKAGPRRVFRELPFMLELKEGDFALFLRGQIDLLFVDDQGAAVVVDYKSSRRPPSGLAGYRFQLGCYALAAGHFVKNGVAVRTGISFLRDDDASPHFDDTQPSLDELRRSLVAQARALVTAQVDQVWVSQPKNRCEAIGCGYVSRCHPL